MRAERGAGVGMQNLSDFYEELGLYLKGNGKFTEMFGAGKQHHQICVFRKVTLATGRRMTEVESPDGDQ